MRNIVFCMLFGLVFAFSNNILAAAPTKTPAPTITAVVLTSTPGQIDIIGTNLLINGQTTSVTSSNQTTAPSIASGSTSSSLLVNLDQTSSQPGNYLVAVKVGSAISNSFDFTIPQPPPPAAIPASSITIITNQVPATQAVPPTINVLCGAGIPIGGGFDRSGTATVVSSFPHATNGVADGWSVNFENATVSETLTAYVICLQAS